MSASSRRTSPLIASYDTGRPKVERERFFRLPIETPSDSIFRMKNSRGLLLTSLSLFSSASVACYDPPGSSERLEESIVITTRDEAVDFSGFRTFFLRPEIRVLDEDVADVTAAEEELLPAASAEPLLSATRDNLIERGYVEAANAADAELAVELVYARTVYSDYYCYYWGDWGYWGYSGYNYYYPYDCTGSAWQSGMVVTHAFDLATAEREPSDELLRGVWYSGVYGVESESADFVVERAAEGITQAFVQSPYFNASAATGE